MDSFAIDFICNGSRRPPHRPPPQRTRWGGAIANESTAMGPWLIIRLARRYARRDSQASDRDTRRHSYATHRLRTATYSNAQLRIAAERQPTHRTAAHSYTKLHTAAQKIRSATHGYMHNYTQLSTHSHVGTAAVRTRTLASKPERRADISDRTMPGAGGRYG